VQTITFDMKPEMVDRVVRLLVKRQSPASRKAFTRRRWALRLLSYAIQLALFLVVLLPFIIIGSSLSWQQLIAMIYFIITSMSFGIMAQILAGWPKERVVLYNLIGAKGKTTLKLREEGLLWRDAHADCATPWQRISRIEQVQEFIFFYLDESFVQFVPKAAFENTDAQETFLQSAKELLAKAKVNFNPIS